jgi:hypothetical protein
MAPFNERRSSWRTIASIAMTVPSRLALRRHLNHTIVAAQRWPHEGSYVKFLLGGRVVRGHRPPSRMRLRGSLRSALTDHP